MSDTPGWAPPQGAGDEGTGGPPPPGHGPPPPGHGTPPGYGLPPGGHGTPPGGPWAPYGGAGTAAPRPGVIPLRPLGAGEILDGAFTTMRHYPKATLGLSAAVMTLAELVRFLVLVPQVGAYTTLEGRRVAALVSLAVSGTAGLVLAGMLTTVVGEAVLGRPIGLGDAWQRARSRLGALVGAALLVSLATVGGLLLLVVPGVYLSVALALTTPALLLEGQPVAGALGRSRDLVRGDWWRCFGVMLLAVLIAIVLQVVIVLPFSLASVGPAFLSGASIESVTVMALAIQTVGRIVAGTVVAPFLAGTVALLYVDRRMRVEGLDVTLARVAADTRPPAAP